MRSNRRKTSHVCLHLCDSKLVWSLIGDLNQFAMRAGDVRKCALAAGWFRRAPNPAYSAAGGHQYRPPLQRSAASAGISIGAATSQLHLQCEEDPLEPAHSNQGLSNQGLCTCGITGSRQRQHSPSWMPSRTNTDQPLAQWNPLSSHHLIMSHSVRMISMPSYSVTLKPRRHRRHPRQHLQWISAA